MIAAARHRHKAGRPTLTGSWRAPANRARPGKSPSVWRSSHHGRRPLAT